MGDGEDVTGPSTALLERRCQLSPGLTTLSQKWGALRLHEDRLEFVADNQRSSFSAPLASFHSPRNWVGRGLTIYRGGERLRFDFTYQDPVEQVNAQIRADELAVLVLQDGSPERRGGRDAAGAARVWTAVLGRITPDPPAGARVRKTFGPEQRTLYISLVLAVIALIVAVGGVLLYVVLLLLQ